MQSGPAFRSPIVILSHSPHGPQTLPKHSLTSPKWPPCVPQITPEIRILASSVNSSVERDPDRPTKAFRIGTDSGLCPCTKMAHGPPLSVHRHNSRSRNDLRQYHLSPPPQYGLGVSPDFSLRIISSFLSSVPTRIYIVFQRVCLIYGTAIAIT